MMKKNEAEAIAETIRVERLGAVAVVTLDRPEKRNALDVSSQRRLIAALNELRPDCSVLVLTGTGRSFCAGVDLKERRSATDGEFARRFAVGENDWIAVNSALRSHPAVVIAAVNGHALGGGLTMVHSSDLALASDQAEFGMPEVTFGAVPAYAGPATGKRLIPKHASFMALTGNRVDAATAERWGIVNQVVSHDQLMPAALALAEHVAAFSPDAIRLTKRLLRESEELDWTEGLELGGVIGTLGRVATQ